MILMAAVVSVGAGCEPARQPVDAATFTPMQPVVESETGDLRILSWNIHGSAGSSRPGYARELAELLERFHPDVVFVQEVHRGTPRSGGVDQLAELAERLGMAGCFSPTLKIGEGFYGTATLVRGAITDLEGIRLPGGGEPRAVTRCRTRLLDRSIDLFSIHLTAWGRLNRSDRRKQIATLIMLVEAADNPIVGGDFNVNTRAPEMRRLREVGLLPAITGDPVTHSATRQSLDHVYVAPSWKIEEAEVIREGPSDHWPVFLRVSPL